MTDQSTSGSSSTTHSAWFYFGATQAWLMELNGLFSDYSEAIKNVFSSFRKPDEQSPWTVGVCRAKWSDNHRRRVSTRVTEAVELDRVADQILKKRAEMASEVKNMEDKELAKIKRIHSKMPRHMQDVVKIEGRTVTIAQEPPMKRQGPPIQFMGMPPPGMIPPRMALSPAKKPAIDLSGMITSALKSQVSQTQGSLGIRSIGNIHSGQKGSPISDVIFNIQYNDLVALCDGGFRNTQNRTSTVSG
ncbi:hypothetical protein CAEBREN_21172 [Caenorhabditis brenneri]|uniref:Uncharacterized protein n=1 Tax=Caenorhabditis brenneri TaxID=135651 RepID=G0NY95_CAEBE|nr:hypothetical protein CAEBREN_21172 [Caenorhabditis brenneri]